jgi:hypothetical protein
LQAAALTERARPNCPEYTVAAEQEEVQEIARLCLTHGAFLEYGLQNRPLQIERFLLLCHDTQADVDSQTYCTGLRWHLAGDQAQERGFASTIRADHGDTLTVPDIQRDLTEQQRLASIAKADVFQPQHCSAARRGRPKVQFKTPVLTRLLDALV